MSRSALHPLSRMVSLASLLGVVVAVIVGFGASAHADDTGTTWSIVPTDAADEGRSDGRVSLRHEVEPGAAVDDAVLVTNHSASAAEFVVQAGDGILGEGGAFDIATEPPTGGGSWVQVAGLGGGSGDRLVLEAGASRTLPITITVPDDATPGDHPAGIVVARTSGEGALSVTHRVGVRLHLRVAGEVRGAVEVRDVQTDYDGSLVPFGKGTVRVSFEVVNTGNVRLGARALIEAAGPWGWAAAESGDWSVDELLPSDSARVETDVEVWPTLRTSADIALTPQIVGEDAVSDPQGAQSSHGLWAVPWTGLLLLAFLIGGGYAWRRRAAATPSPEKVEERERIDA